MLLLFAVVFIAAMGVLYAAYGFKKVRELPEGSSRMSEIAEAIRKGANTFLLYEYKVLYIAVLVLAVLLAVFLSVSSGIAFVIGTLMSGLAGYVGMQMSTFANVRVTNTAKKTKDIGRTLKVALRGGSL